MEMEHKLTTGGGGGVLAIMDYTVMIHSKGGVANGKSET